MIKIFKCLRCSWEWASRQEKPTICPKCKSPYWDKPKKEAKARCPYCKEEYSYREGSYKPPTCNKYECLHKYLHPELRL